MSTKVKTGLVIRKVSVLSKPMVAHLKDHSTT
jgi:hypothetical protein